MNISSRFRARATSTDPESMVAMATFWKTALLAPLAMAFATSALADNERVSLFAISCFSGQECHSNTGSGGLALESYAYGSAYGYNGGIVSARAGFSPNEGTLSGTFLNNSWADLFYTFQIQGVAGVAVPLHVYAYAFVSPILASTFDGGELTVGPDGTPSGTTGFSIQSGVSIDIHGIRSVDPFGNITPSAAHVDTGNNSDNLQLGEQAVLIDQIMYFQSNTDISVQLFAGADLTYNYDGGRGNIFGSASASADPVFTIADPAYNAFQIVGVPNDAPPNVGGVPEPASWALMILGFGMTGYRMRRRALFLDKGRFLGLN